MDPICDDIVDETAALASIVEGLSQEQWEAPTVADGWDTIETVIHLGASDRVATMAVADRDRFAVERERLASGEISLDQLGGIDRAGRSGAEIWAWFQHGRDDMIEAFRQVDPKERVVWLGPDIGARSLATSRLLESWSHSLDVADTFGVEYPQTDRLRHIAHIGFVTRAFSYVNRGMTAPDVPVWVDLAAPDGAVWTWGDEDAEHVVRGAAIDFCRVITRRVPFAQSELDATPGPAAEWMEIAQPWIEPVRISDRA